MTPEGHSAAFAVVEVAGSLPSWYAARLLRSLGGRITRVVPPGGISVEPGDQPTERLLHAHENVLTLDLHDAGAREQLHDELAHADVLLLGARPATAEAWGLDPASAARRHPRLIHAWITGMGTGTGLADRAAHDVNAQSLSGLLALELAAAGDARQPAIPAVDIATALHAALAAVDLLRRRDLGQPGPYRCEISMLDSAIALVAAWAPMLFLGETEVLTQPPGYGLFQTSDGQTLAVGALEGWQRARILAAAGAPAEKNPTLAQIAGAIRTQPAALWLDLADSDRLAITPVLSAAEALDDQHIRARLLVDCDPADPWQRLFVPVTRSEKRLAGNLSSMLRTAADEVCGRARQ
jgi:crotonobetainyl-CoA:carnitine CoA-transferase CaiB-like acyl-CoA transferase